MAKYKLTYFNFRGRAELCRYIFVQAGVDYEDVRIAVEDWPKLKPTTQCGQLPMLEYEGKTLSQSIAIARYLANKFGLAGKTDYEKATADMIVDITNDLLPPLMAIFNEQDPGKKEELKKKITEETCPALCNILEKLLIKNNGGNGYFVGNDVTWADFQISLMAAWPESTGFNYDFSAHPKLKALMDRVEALPKIKAWIDTRPETSR